MSEVNTYIGGFFELELPDEKRCYHSNAIALSTGRACLNLMVEQLKPSKVFLPYYTCDALFQPLKRQGIDYEFYPINDGFDLYQLPELKKSEYLIYINFFGIKGSYAQLLSNEYGNNVIIDNTHQFFHLDYKNSYSFTSARKYFGVPDGAYLYGHIDDTIKNRLSRNVSISIEHNFQRLLGKQVEAYENYLKYEESLTDEITLISEVSKRLLSTVNYQLVKTKRMNNFLILHGALEEYNQIELDTSQISSPFCYPLLLEKNIDKRLFYQNNIFIPTLWGDILKRADGDFEKEKYFTNNILPLPIDHRYSSCDMEKVIDFIKGQVNHGK